MPSWAITDLPTEAPKLAYPSCRAIDPTDLVGGAHSPPLWSLNVLFQVTAIGDTVFLPYMLHEEGICLHGRLSPAYQP